MTKLVNGACNLKLIIVLPSRHFCLYLLYWLSFPFSHLLDHYRSIVKRSCQCLLAVGGIKDRPDVTKQVKRSTGMCKRPLPSVSVCLVQPFDRRLQSFPLCVIQHTTRNASELHLSQSDDSLMSAGMRKWYRIFAVSCRWSCKAVSRGGFAPAVY